MAAVLPLLACAPSPTPPPPVVYHLPPPWAPPPYQPAAKPAPAPAVTFSGANEALLVLRDGLGAAARSCRAGGVAAVSRGYSRLLARHGTLLAAAYRAERQRLGVEALDRRQGRIGDRFAKPQSPPEFCRSAADVAMRASDMDAARLRPAAPRLASELEARLR